MAHAEVLARRAFVRYLHGQLALALSPVSSVRAESIFEAAVTGYHPQHACLREGYKVHLYTSLVPCGGSGGGNSGGDGDINGNGDGGVDISPIADLYKSEVYSLAETLGIIQEIQDAAPTDGLWIDGRTDEDQLGATYTELEWAMKEIENPSGREHSAREKEVLERYLELNNANSHKMNPIPVFQMNRR